MICLPKDLTKKFLEALKGGKLDPAKLSEMTSAERHAQFSNLVGEGNAQGVNALFESKLLLKNQQQGMITWAKTVGGLKTGPATDIISKITKLDRVLNPTELNTFLQDLASTRLGADVTLGEAKTISDLSKSATTLKEQVDTSSPTGSDSRLSYGRALVDLGDYVSGLKNQTKKLTVQDFKNAPGKSAAQAVSNLAGLAKSLKATLDNSVIGRQGLKVLFTKPTIWLKNSMQSFVDIVQTFGGKEVMREVQADVLSRENALNGLYKKEGLAIGTVEEAYPTSLPEKIPVVGRVFKAAETAFTAFQYRTRADIFDRYTEIAGKSGADISGIGKVANSLTGRGTFGQRGESAASIVNNIFFSPRLIKSHIDLLTAHAFDSNIGSFARKQAAMNLVKVVGGIAGVLAIAKAIDPKSVELDPRSADFGKIRIKDTRFDVTGGMSSLATLASRLITSSSKSSTTGKVSKLNTGKFGATTGADVISSFAQNKLSPAASIVKDLINNQDFSGNKPTFLNEANNLLTPLPITTYIELKNNPNSANILAAMIADALGISTNTYSPKVKNIKSTNKIPLKPILPKIQPIQNPNLKPIQSVNKQDGLSEARIKEEIAFRESGTSTTPYTTIGVTNDLGKYQISPATLESFSKLFLGRVIGIKEFLDSPKLQEEFIKKEIDYLYKNGARSLDAFLILHHGGFGDNSFATSRIKTLKQDPEMKRYLNNKK